MRKAFGIGLNKTGTKTLGKCLDILGFNHYSYDLNLLQEYSKRKLDIIFQVSDHYEGFEDWPWPLLYRELDIRYPDSKFILTVRKDPETWFESLCKHADKTGPTLTREIAYGYAMPHHYKEHHINTYNKHNQEVIEYFAGRDDQLTVVCWEKGSGWAELTAFLGVPIPDIPFPHVNQS
nr:sulfotransferase family protein [Bacteroidota bacterium]